MGTLEYDIGEIKYASATIRTTNKGEKIVIRSAKWELYEKLGVILQSGTYGDANNPEACLVNDNVVSALIEGKEKGNYILKFTIEIGPERIIDKCVIKVS